MSSFFTVLADFFGTILGSIFAGLILSVGLYGGVILMACAFDMPDTQTGIICFMFGFAIFLPSVIVLLKSAIDVADDL